MEKIGFIGLGTMGAPMATRLINAGYFVYTMDIDPSAKEKVITKGGVGVDTYSELAQLVDLIILSLPDSVAIESILYSPGLMIDSIKAGTIVIDMGTSDPVSTIRIGADLQSQGAAMIDAPVTGGPLRAEDGTLSCMVGGSEEAFQQVESVLCHLATTIEHVGDVGMGHSVKLLNNMVGVGNLTLLCEVFSLAEKMGVELETMRRIMSAGSAKSFALDFWGERLISRDYQTPAYRFGLAAKDMRLAQKLAAGLDLPYPVFASVHQVFQTASAFGIDQNDVCCIKKVWDKLFYANG